MCSDLLVLKDYMGNYATRFFLQVLRTVFGPLPPLALPVLFLVLAVLVCLVFAVLRLLRMRMLAMPMGISCTW